MRRTMAQCAYCMPRKGFFFALLILSVIAMVAMTVTRSSVNFLCDESLEESVAVLKTRLKFLELQYGGRQEDIYNLQAKIDGGIRPPQDVTGNDVPSTTFSPDLKALLKLINGSRASDALLSPDKPEIIKAPFSLKIMSHLLDNPESLRPAYQLKANRQYADYIIGIPHVKRDKETYLYGTIEFLLNKMTDEDKNCTMIVVMIGETDLAYVVETAHNIELAFPSALDAGLIHVISPNKHYYPDLDALPQTLGDSMKRVKWRTKQNLDAIFLMAYAHSRCLYYLMIEDDVMAEDRFMTEIRKFTIATTVSNPNWFFIQYSTIGGIGKLFRSTDLIHFMTYVQLFYNNMPIDWLTESYLADRMCGINKSAKECADAKTKLKPTYRRNLFKHVGYFSSLKGKLQKVNGVPVVKKVADFFPHDNPPLSEVKTSVENHNNFTILNAYHGDSFFWGVRPKKNDVIEFWFQNPTNIGRYVIRSGNIDHINDKIHDAVLDVFPNKPDADFTTIDDFDEFGMVEGTVDQKYGDLLAIRIRFKEPSKYWVIINEIEFVDRNKET